MEARIEIVRGDITRQQVDAIVNAANSSLLGGGGVDGAIHRAAGPGLLEECRGLDGCPIGQARITKGYKLPARYVIHTVGPVWRQGSHDEAELLASCYRQSLSLAAQYGCETVAFPAISCGVYGYPLDQAARVSLDATCKFLKSGDLPALVRWVMFDEAAYDAWLAAWKHDARP
jgi:O-acetyl-ADP-ribose deacetylase (regulator of RNase III)